MVLIETRIILATSLHRMRNVFNAVDCLMLLMLARVYITPANGNKRVDDNYLSLLKK